MLSCILLVAIAAFGLSEYLKQPSLSSTTVPSTALQQTTVPSTTVSSTTIPKLSTTTTPRLQNPVITSHVIVILLENENGSYVVGSKDAPYINNMLIPNYSRTEDYSSLGHPSLLNYVAIISGSTFNIVSNEYPTMSLPNKNLVDLLSEHNLTWKAYMESLPEGPCYLALTNADGGNYGYFTKHNPFVYFRNIMSNLTRCTKIVPLTQFGIDLESNALPAFSFIAPNILDDGHTAPLNSAQCPPSGTGMQCADIWLSGFLPQIINSSSFANTIVFITWDESASIGNQTKNTNPNNNVLLIAVSLHSKKGFADNTTFYSHYSLLSTIEEIYGLGNLGKNDTSANVLNDLFVNNAV